MLHGCTIGDNSLIGIGAVILNGANCDGAAVMYATPPDVSITIQGQ